MNKHIENRQFRMGKILQAIQTSKSEKVKINKEKLIAVMSLDFCVARRTVMEYINTLIVAGKINEDDFEVEEDKGRIDINHITSGKIDQVQLKHAEQTL